MIFLIWLLLRIIGVIWMWKKLGIPGLIIGFIFFIIIL